MLLDRRDTFGPREYPQADEFMTSQTLQHWHHQKISMSTDIKNWQSDLTDKERKVIERTLNGFVQMEVVINDYWSRKVTKWFPKPEIIGMASVFGAMEVIHAQAYAFLQESLGISDFEAFMHEPTAKAKIDRMLNAKGKSKQAIATSLAIFSAFSEGVSLFSSFAILLSFTRRNLLMRTGDLIRYSILDEQLHSQAGCWLFREFVKEYPEVWTDELKEEINDGARLTVQLEDDFIDQSFQFGDIEGITAGDLKVYMRARTNSKLKELGLRSLWRPDKDKLENMKWFQVLANGNVLQDFFAGNVSSYTSCLADFSKVWEEFDAA